MTNREIERTQPMRKMFTLLAFVCCLIAASVIAYTWVNRQQIEVFARTAVEQHVQDIEQEVDVYIDSALSGIRLTAISMERTMTSPVIDDAGSLLNSLLPGTPFDFFEYIRADGINATTQGEHFDASDRVYYKEGMAGKTGIWINYHPKYAQEYLLDFYTPLHFDGQCVGVLAGTIGADTRLLPMLRMEFFGEKTEAFVCDENGQVIAATFSYEGDMPLQAALIGQGIVEKDRHLFEDRLGGSDTGVFFFHDEDGRSLACVTTVKDIGWSIVHIVPAASFNAVLAKTSGRANAITIAIVVLLLLYILTAIRFLRRSQKADMEEKERQLAEQAFMSVTDALTGLNNRLAYENDMGDLAAAPLPEDLIYVTADVNGLKTVNDSRGHNAGDELLIGAAACMRLFPASQGKVYRIGGDEFVVLIHATVAELKQMLAKVYEETDAWRGTTVQELSLSIGYAAVAEHPDLTIQELAKAADRSMYKEKAAYYASKGIDRRGLQTAYARLCTSYTKILRVNLTTDSCQVIHMDDDREKQEEMGYSSKISDWFRNFGVRGHVHPEDLEKYLAKTDLNYLRGYFAQGKKHISIFYRRSVTGMYRQAIMEMLPAEDYT